MILLIDNYDSFTYNLVHTFGELGVACDVRRNDSLTPAEAMALEPEAIVLSPGPCTPNEAGICCDLIEVASGKIPILGVCLGHQAIGQVFGGEVVRAPKPMHGKVSEVFHDNRDVFEGLHTPFNATRYHSLMLRQETMPDVLEVTARTADGIIMGVAHRTLPVFGVQFHPESIASEHGHELLANFVGIARGGDKPARITVNTGPTANAVEAGFGGFGIRCRDVRRRSRSCICDRHGWRRDRGPDRGFAGDAIHVRGETAGELLGATRAMRARMQAIAAPDGAIDVCGTGGDGLGTLNVSTAVAFVLAGCGVPVAKHGNRAISSRSGAHDVLRVLGIDADPPIDSLAGRLAADGVVFLFAPTHHPALRHAAKVRAELGHRTIFNLLGPLANPANVKRQLTGVYDPAWSVPMAETLGALGTECAWIVHGQGLDELTLSGISTVTEWREGRLRTFHRDAGGGGSGDRADRGDQAAADAVQNAEALLALLQGAHSPYRDTVLLNTAAALIVAGRADDLRAGVATARLAIDSGAALDVLERARRPILEAAWQTC